MSVAMFSWAIAWTNAKIVNEYLSFYNLIFLIFFIGFISIYPFIAKKNNLKILTFYNLKFIIPCSIIFYIYNLSFFKYYSTSLVYCYFGNALHIH